MPPIMMTEGDLAGWYCWDHKPQGRFHDLLGDFYFRGGPDGSVQCRMATDRRHPNGLGYLHGGFLMSFIDQAMFAFIAPQLEKSAAVTLSCATDFLSAGIVGQPIDATGEVLKETGKMIFVRGLLLQGETRVCSFTGTMRKVPRMPRPD